MNAVYQNINTRKAPGGDWAIIGIYPEYTAYQRGHMCALSSVIQVEDEHLPLHWEWLVSFSKMGMARLSNEEIK